MVSTVGVALAFCLLWYYWRGCNWARILSIWSSVLATEELVYWNDTDVSKPVLVINGALGAFLIWWLNTNGFVLSFGQIESPERRPRSHWGYE